MKLFKPDWISHNGQPIFSIDIHPDGSRFATGGQGDGGSSGKVIVWNMTPVSNPEDEMNDDIPKVLCIMENHLACVNSVRWSCNGRYLASGGDDRLIMIWQFAGYGGVGGFGGPANLKTASGERWRCSHTLKGHTGDVLDLAWSPGNQWLASCSIDNTVVIWSVEKFPDIVTTLKGHTSLVKGVTWDPIGSYVASQSDDKTVKIWKTLDWKLETTIKKPFEECTATTHVLRLSWSPDGGYLVSAHAVNNSGPTAQIIERAGWKTDMDFVGHRKAITCTRFNGCVFRKSDPAKGNEVQASLPYTCCAVGSRDRSLSVWLTLLRRPLVVIHDLFENSVMDISWSFNGYSLLCCSWDGTVAFLDFSADEIGQTLTQEEKNKLYKDTYGKTPSLVSQPLIIENPAMLAIQQKKSDVSATDDIPKAPSIPVKYPTEQIETRTSTGKRRIIPVFVAPQEALGGIPRPFGASSAFGKINTNLNLKTPEKLKSDSNSKAEVSPVKESESPKSVSELKIKTPEKATKVTNLCERTSISEDSCNNIDGLDQTPKKTTPHKNVDENLQLKKKAVLDIRLSEKAKPVDSKTPEAKSVQFSEKSSVAPLPKGINKSSAVLTSTDDPSTSIVRKAGKPTVQLKRKQIGNTESPSRKKHKQIRKEHARALSTDLNHAIPKAPQGKEPIVTESRLSSPSTGKPSVFLPLVKTRKSIAAKCPALAELTVLAENELNSDGKAIPGALHKLSCLREKQEVWVTVMSSPINILHVSRSIVGIACLNHSIHVLSASSGRTFFPPLCFGSARAPISNLFCQAHFLMAIDASCHLSVWDTKNSKVIVNKSSFCHLLSDAAYRPKTSDENTSPLRRCSLNDYGLPLLSLQDNRSFTFNIDLSVWVLISSPNDATEQYSEKVAVIQASDNRMTSHEREIFSSVTKKLNTGSGALASRSFHATPVMQRSSTLAFLEHKVAASVMMQSLTEYRRWLLSYVRYLVQENLEIRLREVCNDLIGPPSQRHKSTSGQNCSWKSHVLGMQKRTLLQNEILPIIGSNLSFQRLYAEYQDQLDNVGARNLSNGHYNDK